MRLLTDPSFPAALDARQEIFGEGAAALGTVEELGMSIYGLLKDVISEAIQSRFLELFRRVDDLGRNVLMVVIDGPLPLAASLLHNGARHEIKRAALIVRCEFSSQLVAVDRFTLGNALLTVGRVPCGETDQAYLVAAIQAAEKPGQIRCCTLPLQKTDETKKQ